MTTNTDEHEEEKEQPYYSSEDEYCEEISNEEYSKNVKEMDDLIIDIYRTKHKLKLGKIKSKIKTKEDLLNFFNIRDGENNLLPPEPGANDSQGLLQKMKINTNSKMNQEYSEIKEKLHKQEQILKHQKENNANSEIFNLASSDGVRVNLQSSKNDEMEAIYEQIKLMDSKCEDLLGDIDSCLKLGEDIDKLLDTKK